MIAIQTTERNGKVVAAQAGDARRRDHADHHRRRADPHARRRNPRDGPRHAGRDADQSGRRTRSWPVWRRWSRRDENGSETTPQSELATWSVPDAEQRSRISRTYDFRLSTGIRVEDHGTSFNFSAGPAVLPEEVLRAGAGGDARLARQRHVGDGDEPSRQGVHVDRTRPPRPICASCWRFRRTTRCCSCRAARPRSSRMVPMNLLRGEDRAPTTSIPASGRRRRSAKPRSSAA